MTTTIDATRPAAQRRSVTIPAAGDVLLAGDLSVPEAPVGAVVFAHVGSSDLDPRTPEITGALNRARFATLALDLLTAEEALERENVFDVPLLARRLAAATRWLRRQDIGWLPLGYLGAGTAASASLWASADADLGVRAVVSLGGWLDLASWRLPLVRAATLLIVGGAAGRVLDLNRSGLDRLSSCVRELVVIPGATHNFEQVGALEQVDERAAAWFAQHLAPS